MTAQCAACHAPSPDAFLCQPCTDCQRPTGDRCGKCVTDLLAEMPARLTDLEITATRQARTNSSSQRRRNEPEDTDPRSPFALVATALPFHPRAATLLHEAINHIGGWARHIAETRDVQLPARTVDACCTWLIEHVDSIRLDEAAGEIHARLTDLTQRIDTLIDRRPTDRIYGRCGATVVRVVETAPGALHPYTTVCNSPLYAPQGATEVECIDCGAVYPVGDQKQAMLDAVNDEWLRPHLIANALTDLDEPINASTLRTWIERDAKLGVPPAGPLCLACRHSSCRVIRRERGRIIDRAKGRPLILQVGIDDEGRALYRVGDVRARIAWSKQQNTGANRDCA